jgi:hypothetical protein
LYISFGSAVERIEHIVQTEPVIIILFLQPIRDTSLMLSARDAPVWATPQSYAAT